MKPIYTVHRSGIQVGMKTLSDGYHVERVTRWSTDSIASFWIGEHLPANEAEALAGALAERMNAAEPQRTGGIPIGAKRGRKARPTP
jgi:hypothetical protein